MNGQSTKRTSGIGLTEAKNTNCPPSSRFTRPKSKPVSSIRALAGVAALTFTAFLASGNDAIIAPDQQSIAAASGPVAMHRADIIDDIIDIIEQIIGGDKDDKNKP